MMLLSEIHAMETTFSLKDVFYIGGLLIGGLTAWFKMQRDKDKMSSKIGIIEEKMTGVTASKKAMKVELTEMAEKTEQILHTRIDRVRDDNIKSYEKLEAKIGELDRKYDTNTTKILEALNK